MSKLPIEYLKHIRDEIDYLLKTSEGISFDTLTQDATLQRAFARSLEIIGEAAKKLPLEFRNEHPDIDWKAMTGMRDKLIHDYFGVDYEIVWDVVTHEIPPLKNQITHLIQVLDNAK